jgi:hypothetical protein
MPADPDPFPPPQKLTLKKAEFESVNEQDHPPTLDPLEILRDTRAREIAAGKDNLTFAPARRSRRLREFLALFIGGNLGIGLTYWYYPGAYVFCVAGALIFSSGLFWVMFLIMEDY